jgi:hypothetical protein
MYDDKWNEEPQLVEIKALVLDNSNFPRQVVDQATVEEYAEMMREEGVHFPPIRVVQLPAGQMLVIDGWHRTRAAQSIGCTSLYARIRPGTRSDAVEAAVAQNVKHGLRRTDGDKRRAVVMLLSLEEWHRESDRAVAKHCAVSHTFVAKVRDGSAFASGSAARYEEPKADSAPPPERRIVVHRGDQEYEMTMPRREPSPPVSADPEPFDDEPYDLPRPQQHEPAPPDRGAPPPVDEHDGLSEPEVRGPSRDPWPTRPLAKTINDRDLLAWLLGASDARRRWLADIAFASIESPDERLRHDATVQQWLMQHERGDAAE